MPSREPSFAADPADHPLPPPTRGTTVALGAVLAVALAAAAAWWWSRPATAPVPRSVATAPAPVTAPAPPTAAAIQHPLEEEVAGAITSPQELDQALRGLLGADAVLRFLQVDDFARRVVATVDGLGREHAPATMWPVVPSAGRFSTEGVGEEQRIAAANAQRYQPFVALVASVDPHAAAAVYRRAYPLLQSAYRGLGFGDRYFNDRVVEVIDVLLATPQPRTPPAVRLVEVKGPIPPERPWTRYEFADPQLQSLAAGQKVLLRMAPEQRAVLQAKLRALRSEIAARP